MKIKINSPLNHGACAYYRSIGVISKLKKLDPEISWATVDIRDWHNFIDTDTVMLERPMGMHWDVALKLIKDFGVKLWVDYDDDLINIPPYHEQTKLYHSPENINSHKLICGAADVVTVSTEKLKDIYGLFNNNVHVVPNAFNDYNFKLNAEPSKNKKIFWRGGPSQHEDMLTVIDEILKLSDLYPEWEWYFLGESSKYLTRGIKNAFYKKTLPLIEYFTMLKETNPAIVIKPLQDNDFNQAKSNITWIEATYCGAVTVAPSFKAWAAPGIINYSDPENFKDVMNTLMSDEILRHDHFTMSSEFINNNLMLSKVNRDRLNIAKELLS
jgi:hypothetical protein